MTERRVALWFALFAVVVFAAGLATLLRSGVATLSVLIPFILVVSFVIGDAAGTVVEFMPDRAGQVVLYETHDGTLGPWSGLAVTALWTAAALAAGAWSLRRRGTEAETADAEARAVYAALLLAWLFQAFCIQWPQYYSLVASVLLSIPVAVTWPEVRARSPAVWAAALVFGAVAQDVSFGVAWLVVAGCYLAAAVAMLAGRALLRQSVVAGATDASRQTSRPPPSQ